MTIRANPFDAWWAICLLAWLMCLQAPAVFAQSNTTHGPATNIQPDELDQLRYDLARLLELGDMLDELAAKDPAVRALLAQVSEGNNDGALQRLIVDALEPPPAPPVVAAPTDQAVRNVTTVAPAPRPPALRVRAADILYAHAGGPGVAAKVIIEARGRQHTLSVGDTARAGADRIRLVSVEQTETGALRVRLLVNRQAVDLEAG